jgi:hypothetical protein
MKTRVALLATALLVTGGIGAVSSASAKTVKPVCNLVQDAKGDSGVSPVPGSDGDDIVSADVASNATTITGVIRLAALTLPDPQAPLGRSYSVLFTAPGSGDLLYVAARTYPQGTKYIYGYQAVDPNTTVNTNYTLGDATGVVDTAKAEIRISVPVKSFVDGAKAKLAPGAKLVGLSASVDRIYGQGVVPSQSPAPGAPRLPLGGVTLQFDSADGGSYVMGTPSCVVVGK